MSVKPKPCNETNETNEMLKLKNSNLMQLISLDSIIERRINCS